ncbi:unnamed protein product [Chondrus crispus]|uniref:Uncharacterized protein n=1 Tax=Chondrus crispus TaxID=2769 RepID=R7QCU6_CHOCR|nr:unnamed protein product [Chondrus crispus]CDF35256.1 unnamed protein product [Chondrus crispus]|eukprot:XP_005715075.1 unnamed protein product [Chondrus crispus]
MSLPPSLSCDCNSSARFGAWVESLAHKTTTPSPNSKPAIRRLYRYSYDGSCSFTHTFRACVFYYLATLNSLSIYLISTTFLTALLPHHTHLS